MNIPQNGGEDELVLTWHAQKRGRQRNFTNDEVQYVLEHGRVIHRTGICFYFLGAKDIPLADRESKWAQHLIGTSILVSTDSHCIITLYRNQKALQTIKKKSKRRIAGRNDSYYEAA